MLWEISLLMMLISRWSLYEEGPAFAGANFNRTFNMRFTQPMFKFTHAGETLAVIQAADKRTARLRAPLVNHLVKIPKNCKVKVLPRGAVCRGPVFFEGHFLAIEDALSEA